MISTKRYTVRKWSPTPEQAEFLRAVEPTRQFLQNLPAEVRQDYAGQWIAAKGSAIVAAADTRDELCAILGGLDDPYILKLPLEKGINIR